MGSNTDPRNLTRDPIETRKAALAKLLHQARPSLQLVEHLEADGAIVFEHACQLGAEGVVSKRAGSRQRSRAHCGSISTP